MVLAGWVLLPSSSFSFPGLLVGFPRTHPSLLPLFTGVRGETVWKIGMGSEIGVLQAAKRGPKSPDRPPFAAQAARSRGLWLFSKQFRKVRCAGSRCLVGYCAVV